MSDPVGFAELEAQHVELLPSRTVLSMFIIQGDNGGGSGTDSGPSFGTAAMALLGMNPGGDGADGTSNDGDNGAAKR